MSATTQAPSIDRFGCAGLVAVIGLVVALATWNVKGTDAQNIPPPMGLSADVPDCGLLPGQPKGIPTLAWPDAHGLPRITFASDAIGSRHVVAEGDDNQPLKRCGNSTE